MDKMEPNDQWDEYDWEHVMRQSDLYAHKYMELFSDFGEVSDTTAILFAANAPPDPLIWQADQPLFKIF